MNKVAIFTDSTADLSQEDYKNYNIHVIPLLVDFGDVVRKDDGKINPKMIFASVAKTGKLPSTAGVAPSVFENEFKVALDEGYDVYYIGIGSTLSSSYQSAMIAKNNLPEGRVYIGDSKNLSSASGLLVLKACKMRDKGMPAKEIFEEVEKLAPLLSSQFVVEKLDYLHKGGRCSATALWAGRLLKIHPMIKVINGKLEVYKTPKGKLSKAFDELYNEFMNDYPNIDLDHIFINCTVSDPNVYECLVAKLAEHVDRKIIEAKLAGCVISSHCGENTVGLVYLKTK